MNSALIHDGCLSNLKKNDLEFPFKLFREKELQLLKSSNNDINKGRKSECEQKYEALFEHKYNSNYFSI